jgi:hypothetical protein
LEGIRGARRTGKTKEETLPEVVQADDGSS